MEDGLLYTRSVEPSPNRSGLFRKSTLVPGSGLVRKTTLVSGSGLIRKSTLVSRLTVGVTLVYSVLMG